MSDPSARLVQGFLVEAQASARFASAAGALKVAALVLGETARQSILKDAAAGTITENEARVAIVYLERHLSVLGEMVKIYSGEHDKHKLRAQTLHEAGELVRGG